MPNADLLVFAPHPDDAELCCGGLLLKARGEGLKVVVVDVTEGENSTRGSVAVRRKEAAAASRVLRLAARENLRLPDGRVHDDDRTRTAFVRMLRKYRPALVLAPHWEDQHPDHAAVGAAAIYASFLAGVPRYDQASRRGVASADRLPYRPRLLLHYNNRYGIKADVVVDITEQMDGKLELVRCFSSQFGPGPRGRTAGLQTRLSHPQFIDWLRAMHQFYGFRAGCAYGEAYALKTPLPLKQISTLL